MIHIIQSSLLCVLLLCVCERASFGAGPALRLCWIGVVEGACLQWRGAHGAVSVLLCTVQY